MSLIFSISFFLNEFVSFSVVIWCTLQKRGQEELPHVRGRGGGLEEQPHVQGTAATGVQEGWEELFHIHG